MKKLINFVAGFCSIIILGGVLTIGLSLSSCSNRTTMPVAPSINQVFRAKDIPSDAVTTCGGYVVSVGCSAESMCPPVDNSGAGGSCTIYAIITPPTTPVPTNTPTLVPTPTGSATKPIGYSVAKSDSAYQYAYYAGDQYPNFYGHVNSNSNKYFYANHSPNAYTNKHTGYSGL